MNSNESIKYKKYGFDRKLYHNLQGKSILKRVEKFSKGRLYLEVGGKFLNDAHASRVLPGFDAKAKIDIFKDFEKNMEILFCVNANDIANNRKLYNFNQGYIKSTIELINTFKKTFKSEILIAINLVEEENFVYAKEYKEYMAKLGFRAFFRYVIPGYPKSDKVLSLQGYGQDEYVQVSKPLILVTGPASGSGKMSTCLGQIYLESLQDMSSGYAKYETFPIWNLPLEHPINLAYEAATADIGDYNQIDSLHAQHHNIKAVNYNRDIQAFKIVKDYSQKVADHRNFMYHYKSPTDMGISTAGFCITNDEICCIASIREIERRIDWYKQTKDRDAIRKCKILYEKALRYINNREYYIDKEI